MPNEKRLPSFSLKTSNFFKEVNTLGNYSNIAFTMLLIGNFVAVLTFECGVTVCFKRFHILV